MGFNLNRTQHPDYKLKERQIKEMIGIYGVECSYIGTTKMNVDKVLMDFSHLVSDKDSSINVTLLPETSEGWDGELNWDLFGLHNQRTINFFVSSNTVKEIEEKFKYENKYSGIINSLLVLPSGTILEITDMVTQVEGINNLFTYSDDISVYRFNTKVYYNSQQNEIDVENISKPSIDSPEGIEIDYNDPNVNQEQAFDDLDDYFAALDDNKLDQDIEGQTISNSDSVFGNLG